MATEKQKLFTEFPAVSPEEWKEKVIADLKGAPFEKKLVWRTAEGFELQPAYFRRDIQGLPSVHSMPGEYPFVRSTKLNNEWLVRQDIEVSDAREANAKALDILNKGVTSLGFKIKKDLLTAQTFETLFAGIDLTAVEINLICCITKCDEALRLLAAYAQKVGTDPAKINGSVSYNPYKKELVKGRVNTDRAAQIEAVWEAGKALPGMRLYMVEGVLLNNAGAFITQELGYALAWGAQIVETLTQKGYSVKEITPRIKFNWGISTNYFMEIAKFRAARWLWAQIIGAYGDEYKNDAAKIYQHAVTSRWNMTLYDAHVNLLRTQTETMSAAIAGVDSITVLPFDAVYEQANDFGERIARNQQLLLSEESHFDKVIDPAAGSYYLETLTHAIGTHAWDIFLSVEENGGFEAQVTQGKVQESINASNEKRHQSVAGRKESLLGTNQFPNFNETVAEKINPAFYTNTLSCSCSDEGTTITALNFERAAYRFESLRLATERAAQNGKKQPVVFMLTIGNLAMRLARSQFAGNFFGCAGYKLIDNLGFETVADGINAAIDAKADVVVLCSSDDEYEQLAPEAFKLLAQRALFVVAGNPACTDALKAQGIEHFIHVKSDVLATLTAFSKHFGLL